MFKTEVAAFLADHVELSRTEVVEEMETPPRRELGEAALPCFTVAQERGESPQDVAKELSSVDYPDAVERVETRGPYLNFHRAQEHYQAALKELDTTPHESKDKTVTIDYSSPNIAKPFSIGHLRSTVIGQALANIYEFHGWDVVTINHLGDWGTQFGNLIAAYKRWPVDLDEDPIQELMNIYVRFNQEARDDEDLRDEGKQWFKRLEDGDDNAIELWERFRKLSLDSFSEIYEELGASFDHVHGESFYRDKMDRVITALRDADLLEESEGAQVVPLEEYDMPPCIVRKSDGATTYATRELAGALYRADEYGFDKNLYEVGSEQSLHFKQVFKVLELLGKDWADDCVHVQHGLYKFEDTKMSTREGNVVFASELFDEAKERVRRRVRQNEQDVDEDVIADKVGVGALIFNDLKNDRVKDIGFDWDEVLDLDGDSGPYLQYTHARLAGIAGESDETPQLRAELDEELEQRIISHLERFTPVIQKVVRDDKPHHLARWLLELAHTVNTYYQKHRVVQDDKSLERSRLFLVERARGFLERGLALLGLDAPTTM